MGIYFNPSNASFRQARNSMVYVDKTNLLNFLNRRLFTEDKCIALSHSRRFGKSHAAGMIDAYYSLGCDSTKLFENTKLASNADYKKHMHKYNVIHLDISSFWDDFKDNIIKKIQEYILDECKKEFKDKIDFTKKFNVVLMSIYDITNIPFVIIIDEWDCIIRNSHDENLIHCSSRRNPSPSLLWHISQVFCQSKRLRMNRRSTTSGSTQCSNQNRLQSIMASRKTKLRIYANSMIWILTVRKHGTTDI